MWQVSFDRFDRWIYSITCRIHECNDHRGHRRTPRREGGRRATLIVRRLNCRATFSTTKVPAKARSTMAPAPFPITSFAFARRGKSPLNKPFLKRFTLLPFPFLLLPFPHPPLPPFSCFSSSFSFYSSSSNFLFSLSTFLSLYDLRL